MTTPTKKPAAVRVPQDRKPKQSELLAAEATNDMPAGAELLRLETLAAWDQAEAIATITELFGEMGINLDPPAEESGAESTDSDAEGDDGGPERGIALTSDNLRVMGKLVKLLLDYADDREAFTAVVSGPGALIRGVNIAMWYFGALGEGSSSAS
jgi:hypothetical protein